MIVLAFLTACAGFAGLAMAMPKHYREVFRSEPTSRVMLACRACGWLLLVASFWLSVAGPKASVGAVFWVGILTAAALLVALVLTYLFSARHRQD
jgi:uncharacterized membrane protein